MHIIKKFSTQNEMLIYEKENIRTHKPKCNIICYMRHNIEKKFSFWDNNPDRVK